jgi:hypothetical protein
MTRMRLAGCAAALSAAAFAACGTVRPGGPQPCAAVLCPEGTRCVVTTRPCRSADCADRGECVPLEKPVRCGGVGALRCPGAGACVDDPSDDCDPRRGGTDCAGVCSCAAGDCPAGTTFDARPSVCACMAPGGGVVCGLGICARGLVCCNPSCGICTPPGGVCIQQVCEPPPPR